MKRLLIVLSALVLAWTAPALAEKVTTLLDSGVFDAPFGGGPRVTWLTDEEGGNNSSGLMTRINPTTFVITSPGEDRDWNTSDDGVWHCFKLGTAGQDCEFFETGALSEGRRVLRVNNSTGVLLALGDDEDECEDGTSNDGDPDDKLLVLKKLGTTGATVATVNEDFCFFTPAADPIRINDNTIIFAQPGDDKLFHDSSTCDDEALDDEVVVVRGLLPGGTIKVDRLNVGDELGVFLTGSPASRAVRINNNVAVLSSPGEDGEYGDGGEDSCVDTTGVEDDGLVVVKGMATQGGRLTLDFVEVGNLAANHASRPVLVNQTNGSVVILGTGDNQQQQESIDDSLNCCWSITASVADADDVIHVVKNLIAGTPAVQTVGGAFGFMRRPSRLNNTTAVAFDENDEDAGIGSASSAEQAVKLSVHIVSGVGATAKEKTLTVPSGDGFWEGDWHRKEIGVVMSDNRILFATHGPPQVLLLNNGLRPFFGAAGGAADDWAKVFFVKVNSTIAGYTVAKEGQVGLLKITTAGGLEDHRLTSVGGEEFDETGTHQPASQPTVLSPSKFIVAAGGGSGEFAEQGFVDSFGGDDGFFIVSNVNTRPTLEFVTVGNLCGAPGCKPLVLGTPLRPMVAFAGPGANGEFDSNDDQTDNDDELIIVTDVN